MAIELADIMRRFGPLYLERFSGSMLASHKRAIADIQHCRTAAMGGHVYHCDGCGKQVYVYHACRNRHCPACHRDQIHKWLQQRTAELLPCDYFHVTVTIPETLRRVFRSHQKQMYSLLMKTASKSLIQLADDPKHLGGRIGILAVLHTWTSNLTYHPHVHMLVTGGGVADDDRWKSSKHKYLVPVKALSRLIRGKLAARLRKSDPDLYRQVDPMTWSKDWVVHSLHYGQGQSVVLQYLARYVFRIAITNHRIISMDHTHVTFRYKDRKGSRWITSRIEGCEFIRRYLQHVLPKGFHKVRYYGIWHTSNSNHVSTLADPMTIAAMMSGRTPAKPKDEDQATPAKTLKCPHCGSDQLILLEKLPRPRSRSPSFQRFTSMQQARKISFTEMTGRF
ncbi:MAG: IS91 family transposase [Planctomycetota bacterium]|jgi:DNA-directed RNA polymerase subunit RPC12/RpoP